jgi:hypothetical protein
VSEEGLQVVWQQEATAAESDLVVARVRLQLHEVA